MNVLAILGRELLSLFLAPLGWVVLALFLLVQGYSFCLLVELQAQPVAPHGPVLQHFFGGSFLYWLFLILVVSVVTMRLCAEERRSGTLEALLTAPVTEAQVVLGKYLAALIFYVAIWTPTLVYVVLLARLSPQGSLAWGTVLSGYLGTLLVGASCLAVGLLASALTRSQLIAAVLSFALLSLLLLLGPLALFVRSPSLRAVIAHLDLFDQMDEFARGVVDSRRVVLHLSLVLLCLVAATKALELKRWR